MPYQFSHQTYFIVRYKLSTTHTLPLYLADTEYIFQNHIGCVMVNVFASSALDRGFEPRSSQTNDYMTCIYCFSAKHVALWRAMTGWLEIGIMCPNGATCLSADCCFSELALWKSNSACWSSTKRISLSLSHPNVTCSCHDITEEKKFNWP